MNMRHAGGATVLLLGLCLASGAFAAGDAAAGKSKFTTCAGCHSIPGYSNAYPTYRVPRIGGQHEQYIAAALHAYAAGERNHETMRSQAASLSEQDIADIAAYVASAGK